jgi:GH35 family endo-1,4-beta-xylanase
MTMKNTTKSVIRRETRSIVFICLILAMLLSSVSFNQLNKALSESDVTESTTSIADNNIFGAEMVQITDNYGFQKMKDDPATPEVDPVSPWIRVNGVLWSDVEATAGTYNWTVLDNLSSQIDIAIANGIEVMLVVRSTPTWAQKNPGYPCGPIAQNNLKDFANFMSLLVQRYAGKVKYWEIWNEPDAALGVAPTNGNYGCWGDTNDAWYGGEYYGDMLELIYPEIKAADPNGKVIVGGLMMDCGPGGNCANTNVLKFIEGVLRSGAGNSFDGIAFHSFDYFTGGLGNYGNTAWNTSRATTGPTELAKVNYLLNILGQYGVMGKFLMNTETALVCDTGCTDAQNTFENTKAYFVAQDYAIALAKNLKSAIWYGARMGWRNTDLLYLDLTPRPAYYAFKFGRQELNGAKYQKELPQFPGVMGYQFIKPVDDPNNNNMRRIWVLWSKDGVNHPVTLPGIPFNVFDVDGTPQSISTQVTIKLEPYYIELKPEYALNLPTTYQNYQAILNANFERGLDGSNPVAWTIINGGFVGGLITSNPTNPQVDTEIPMGSASMQLGEVKNSGCPSPGLPIGYSAINQTFVVPYSPGSVPVKLTFKYIIYSQDTAPIPETYDAFEVRINDQVLFRDMNQDATGQDECAWHRVPVGSGWASGSIDLTAYRGQTVTVSFQNWNRVDGYFDTVTYLDRVYIEIGN